VYTQGNVGIGTSSPLANLHVEGVAIVSAAASGGGAIELRDAAGLPKLVLHANYNGPGGTGDSRVVTNELEITGGSDLSEQFDIAPLNDTGAIIAPGSVVCIDPQSPGALVVSSRAYDRTVAGVVSGAAGVKPGLLMGQRNTPADGRHPVALTGRVYVRCTSVNGSIEPGDLLTTSDIPGLAMKVTDHSRAHGAVIGKAMSRLGEPEGLVLVLVSLQ
jgi:hypothetical protein